MNRPPASEAGSTATGAFEETLWRGLGVFRVLTLGYAVVRYIHYQNRYQHPVGGWIVVLAMTLWTAFATVAYRAPELRRGPVVAVDLLMAVGSVLATRAVDTYQRVVVEGVITIPSVWSSCAVISTAIWGRWGAGAVAALVVGGADMVESGHITLSAVHNTVLLLVAGTAIGYANELARRSERQLARAHRLEAATRERDRLARDIHDGVLQVLALVQRRGAEIGGEAAALGRLAGEQEVALRNLVTVSEPADELGVPVDPAAEVDLRTSIGAFGGRLVKVALPGTPVLLPSYAVHEVASAVGAALDNVRVHVGLDAPAWVLVEDEGHRVVVTIRDDGPGFPAQRLAEAESGGRLGVAQSIKGRLRDLGGDALVTAKPGQGTEVELRVPRPPAWPEGRSADAAY